MVLYCFFVCIIKWVGYQLVEEVFDCCLFILWGVIGISWDDGIRGGGFSVNLKGDFLVIVDDNIEEIDAFTPFWFYSKSQGGDILLNCSCTLCMSVLLLLLLLSLLS